MTRKRNLILWTLGVVTVVVGAPLVYLSVSDLSGWRDTVARAASKGMARELTIAGEFKVDLGIVTRIHATELSLANTGWGSEPSMASIDRLDGEINLCELFSGSIHLPSVDIEGGRAIFESDAEKGSNWKLGSGDGTGGGGPVRLRIDKIRGRDVDLIFRTASNPNGWDLAVASLESAGDEGGNHRLTGAGTLDGTGFDVNGGFGSLESLINLWPFDHDLRLRLGEAELTSSGRIANIATSSGLDLRANAVIPNPEELFAVLGLPAASIPAFTADATGVSSSGLTRFTLAIDGPTADLRAEGTIDSLPSPAELDLDLRLDGPDIRPVGALAGIRDLAPESFDLAGHLTWRGFPLEITGLEARVGDNRFTVDGRVGAPPVMLGTDLHIKGAGPNAAAVAALAALSLSPEPFAIDGHLLRVENGLRIDGVKVTIGAATLTTSGFLGDPPRYAGTDLVFEAGGPGLDRFNRLLGITAPAEPFHFKGRLADGAGAIDLREVDATLGPGSLEIDGRLTTVDGMIGTELSVKVDGRDLSKIGDLFDLGGLPPSPFRAEGRMTVTNRGFRLHNVSGQTDDFEIAADGLLTRTNSFVGSKLEIEAAGGDLSILAGLAPSMTLPTQSFRVAGEFEVLEAGIGLHEVELGLGSATGSADGRIVWLPTVDGTELRIAVRGPSLAVVDPLVPQLILPDVEFSVSGAAGFADGRLELREVAAALADNSARITGTIVPGDNLTGSMADVNLEGRDLGSFERLVEGMAAVDLPDLPARPFSFATALTLDKTGAHIASGKIAIGAATASVTGTVGALPGLPGTDLEISAQGPDASIFTATAGIDLPAAPFELSGRVATVEAGLLFDSVRARLGDALAELDGTLGRPPKLVGTDLTVRAGGSDPALLRALTGSARLPNGPFSLAGHFQGDPRRFSADNIDLRFGSSDLSGTVQADLEGKPHFTAHLHSNRLRAADFNPPGDGSAAAGDEEKSTNVKAPPELMIPNDPWNLAFLDRLDAELDWDIRELEVLRGIDREIEISILLADGAVTIDRFRRTGHVGATLTGSASLSPAPEGHRLVVEFHLADSQLNLAGETADPSQYTPTDIDLTMSVAGRTAHEMAASADGRIVVNIGAGVLQKSIIDVLSADVLVTLLEALNPFAKHDTHTNLNCSVLVANFADGVMTLDPAAVQTDKVTILGHGTIDFSTEKLRLDWITKPREGIGVSASMFTNPYIRLGGTLSRPAIEMKPAQALASTGLAVVTMGITLVGKGLLDRITSEKKVCEQATNQAEKQLQEQAPR